MVPETDAVVVLITAPDERTLAAMAETLVSERLAACVNVIPAARSVYRWEGGVQDQPEAIGIIKTARHAIPDLRRRVKELHPYDVPEFLSLVVDTGDSRYLDWLMSCVPRVES